MRRGDIMPLGQLEGGGGSRLSQAIRALGYNKAVDIEIGTIVKPLPNIEVALDADEGKIVLDKDILYIPRNLTKHKRVMTFKKVTDGRFIDDFTTLAHIEHNGISDFEFSEVEVEYQDELKVGDRVLVAWLDEQMMAVIIDVMKYYGD